MSNQLDRSNTTTTFSSFFCTGTSKPSPLLRPPPPANYQHIKDDTSDPPSSFLKLCHPRTNGNRSIDLRASKLGMVEKMTSRERIEKWNELSIDPGEVECQPLTPLEKWRLEVAKEVAKEKRREEVEAQQRRKDEEEQQEQGRITSWKPSVLTSSSMRSAKKELQNQFESSSPFARSFAVETLKTPRTADSAPTSSVVRESFLNDERKPHEDHPYSQTFGFDEATGTLIAGPPRTPAQLVDSTAEETLLVPSAPETCASVSPIDPVFAPADTYRFPLSEQRHPLPKIDTSQTPVSAAFSNSPVSAPVVTTYQAFTPPPRSSSLPFNDLNSIHLTIPSPPSTSVPPPVPPKDTPSNGPDPSFSLLPPKAAALLGLIPTSHPLVTPRPPKPRFARERQDSLSSSGSPDVSRSSFYTNYDGPTRPSMDSTTPTTISHFHKSSSSFDRCRGVGIVQRSHRPPPLTFKQTGGMSSLPDLHQSSTSSSTSFQRPSGSSESSSSVGGGGGYSRQGSSVSSSVALSRQGRSSLETPRTIVFQAQSNSGLLYQTQSRGGPAATRAESEIESLLDAPLHHDPTPSPPFIPRHQASSTSLGSRFGSGIGQDLSSRSKGGGNSTALRARASGSNLARSISQKGKGLARKLSLRNIHQKPTELAVDGRISKKQDGIEEPKTTKGRLDTRRSLKDLKKGLDQKLENSFRYW